QIKHDDPKKELKLMVLILTPLGHELKSLCPATIDSIYLNHVIDTIKSLDFKVIIGDCIRKEDGEIYSKNEVEV
ncbi:hypothetical protein BRW12_003583, partial [Escherichia coli]|nr:hypothetical protein [Escherichia coli]